MKSSRYDYNSLEYLNPWKGYKQGLFPRGVAIAYQKKWGYDPIKIGFHFWCIEYLRTFAWAAIFAMIIVLLPFTDSKISAESLPPWMKYFVGIELSLLVVGFLIITFTWKLKRQLQRKVWGIQKRISYFMSRFEAQFKDRPASDFATEEAVQSAVNSEMVTTAGTIVEAEIMTGAPGNAKFTFENLDKVADEVGLSREWQPYFDEAKKQLNLYKCFDPAI